MKYHISGIDIEEVANKLIVGSSAIKKFIDIKESTFETGCFRIVSDDYFKGKTSSDDRATYGVVETPSRISRFMVSLAMKKWRENTSNTKELSEIHWFDPCGGAGVFPVEIIDFYINTLGVNNAEELPYITISELSVDGVVASAENIISYLMSKGIDISKVIEMNKVKIFHSDTLAEFFSRDDLLGKSEFDIVIGNPPYVRAKRIDKIYKEKLKSIFGENYSGEADLFNYFIMSGVNLLASGGVLAFISPASFIRIKSASNLREWLFEKTDVLAFIDLDECRVFNEADVHSAIYVFRDKTSNNPLSDYLHVKNENELTDMLNDSSGFSRVIIHRDSDKGWSFHLSEDSLSKFKSIFRNTIPMSSLGIFVYSGVRTGYAKAYLISKEVYDEFSLETKKKWLKPIILPAHIKRWHGYKNINYLVFTPYGIEVNNKEVICHLSKFKERLSVRSEVKNSYWYSLRTCSYYDEMLKKKIAFPDLSSSQRFSLVDEGILIPDGAYFLNTDNLIVLGILNSNFAKEYFINHCSSVGNLNSKGRFRFKKEFVKNFPMPRNILDKGHLQCAIEKVVAEILEKGDNEELNFKLNELISGLYKVAND